MTGAPSDAQRQCNVCGGSVFGDMRARRSVRCLQCGSLERTRVLMLHLSRLGMPQPGQRVLHFAPEAGLSEHLRSVVGSERYTAYDLTPERYGPYTQPFDLCATASELPRDHFDLIIHNHVIEHLPCNYTAVLFHLHRALTPDGLHICCIPFLEGDYEERWAGLSPLERTRRFGQDDHVRRFGAADVARSLGMVFRLPAEYDLGLTFSRETLDQANVPEHARRGYTPHTVLVLRKEDLLLR